jgi:3-deoxy-D-manno-octulosonic acid kinase
MPRLAEAFLLFDRSASPGLTEEHFELEWWKRQSAIVGSAQGRGTVFFAQMGARVWALRRYLRGGWMGRINRERYLWPGLSNSRPWREWHLLAELRERGLPVPRPIAARVQRRGLVYRGDLITERIESSTPLCQLIRAGRVTTEDWRGVGALLARFHRHGVRHDDINVSNVLRDEHGVFHLIDFDKAQIVPAGAWLVANLARFRRSIEKLLQRAGRDFDPADWETLMDGYGADAALRDHIQKSLERRRNGWWLPALACAGCDLALGVAADFGFIATVVALVP